MLPLLMKIMNEEKFDCEIYKVRILGGKIGNERMFDEEMMVVSGKERRLCRADISKGEDAVTSV